MYKNTLKKSIKLPKNVKNTLEKYARQMLNKLLPLSPTIYLEYIVLEHIINEV